MKARLPRIPKNVADRDQSVFTRAAFALNPESEHVLWKRKRFPKVYTPEVCAELCRVKRPRTLWAMFSRFKALQLLHRGEIPKGVPCHYCRHPEGTTKRLEQDHQIGLAWWNQRWQTDREAERRLRAPVFRVAPGPQGESRALLPPKEARNGKAR